MGEILRGPQHLYGRIGKRSLDLALGVVILAVTSPLYAAISGAIAVTTGLPVHYRQMRAGRGSRPFYIIKFRTMAVGTDRIDGGGYPSPDMVTPVGRFLRRTSLDELPQILNVLRGDMSLVGPRPSVMEQTERYSAGQKIRLDVRPGVTGLAQIRYRNDATWSKRIESDVEYVRKLSLVGDLAILLRTLPAAVRGSGMRVGQTVADVDDLGGRQCHAQSP